MKVLAAILPMFFLAGSALADHAVENASTIARLAYNLADDAEALEIAAFRDSRRGGGGFFNGGIEELGVVSDAVVEPMDHRAETLQRFAQQARSLHLDTSDLYRTARRVSWGGNRPLDHRGDDIRSDMAKVDQSIYELKNTYRALSRYALSWRLRSLYSRVVSSAESLEWYVYGSSRQ
jgi:hypothetical protein